MPVNFLNDNYDVDLGIAPQTVDAQTIEQGPYERLLHTGATYERTSAEVMSGDMGDNGGETGRRRISRGGNAAVPMSFRYQAGMTLEEAAFCDDYDTELTITGSGAAGDVDYSVTATHQDGKTNQLQIKLPLGVAVDLKNGVGDGILVLNEDWANAGNNQPFMVKNVWDNGVNDLIDIDAGYGGGVVTDLFGAPKTAAASQTAILHFGQFVKNRRKNLAAKKRVYSVLRDSYCLSADRRFQTLLGAMANDYVLSVPGEGLVTVNVPFIGRRWTRKEALPQNGEAIGDQFFDPVARDFMVGGEDLEFLSIVTYPNAQVLTALPINLSNTFLQTFDFSLTGSVEAKTNILGMKGVMPKRGLPGFTGSIGYYVPDDALLTQLEDLGDEDFHQKAAVHVIFKDPDGNWKGLTLPKNEFACTISGGGGAGDDTATLEFGPEARSVNFRAAILQQWAAFA